MALLTIERTFCDIASACSGGSSPAAAASLAVTAAAGSSSAAAANGGGGGGGAPGIEPGIDTVSPVKRLNTGRKFGGVLH